MRCAWMSALADRDFGVEVRGRGVDRVDRDLGGGQRPGQYGFVQFEVGLMFSAIASSVALLLGPRLENVRRGGVVGAAFGRRRARLEVARVRVR